MGFAIDPEQPTTILNAAAATGAGDAWANVQRRVGGLFRAFAWQVVTAGAPTGLSVTLQGSLDGVNWTTIDTSTATGGETRDVSAFPATFLRANVGTLTGGTNPTVSVSVQPGG